MTLYFLDATPRRCAKYHCDRHLNECLESTVMVLCGACRKNGYERAWMWEPLDETSDFGTWVCSSYRNWKWAYEVACEMYDEYRHRNGEDARHTAGDMLMKFKLDTVEAGFDLKDEMTRPPWVFDDMPEVDKSVMHKQDYGRVKPYNEFDYRALIVGNRYCYFHEFENMVKYKHRLKPPWVERIAETMDKYMELYGPDGTEVEE